MSKNESSIYRCEICDYNSKRQSNLLRHYKSIRHKNNILATNGNKNEQNEEKKFLCSNCDKGYNSKSGLWRHKKTCNIKYELVKDENLVIKELKTIILDQQNKIKEQNKQINDLIPKIGSYNNNKQKFNINVFLNEECKDAISIMIL